MTVDDAVFGVVPNVALVLAGACFVAGIVLWALSGLASRIGEVSAKAVVLITLVLIVALALSFATTEEKAEMVAPFEYLWSSE